MKKLVVLKQLFILVLFVVIIGCGGNGTINSETLSDISKTISGKAIDGYISGATVCLDLNKNSTCDSNEPSTTTNSDGSYSLEVNNIGIKHIIMIGGIDTSTNKNFEGVLKDIIEIKDSTTTISSNITPLTTLCVYTYEEEIKINPDYIILDAKEEVAFSFDINLEDIGIDPLSNNTIFEKTQQIFQIVTLLQKTIQSDDSDSLKNKNAFSHILKQLSLSLKNNIDNKINITDLISKIKDSSYLNKQVEIPTLVEEFVKEYSAVLKQKIEENINLSNFSKLEKGFQKYLDEAVTNIKNDTSFLTDTLEKLKIQSTVSILKSVNKLPIISGTPSLNIEENQNYVFTPSASDEDKDNLIYQIENKPTWLIFDENTGKLSGTPSFTNQGVYQNIIISVSDSIDTVSLESFDIEVLNINRVPVAIFSDFSINEDRLFSGNLTGTDLDSSDILTYVKVKDTIHGKLTLNVNGSFTYQADENYNGVDSFIYKINDNIDDSEEKIVNITINSVNDAPIIISNNSIRVDENQIDEISIKAKDIDNQNDLIYSLSGTDKDSFNINKTTGVITFKIAPDFEQKEIYTFVVNVSDREYIATQIVIINIRDIIDTVPTLSNSTGSVLENSIEGTSVGRVIISDSGDSAITSITLSGIGYENFKVSNSGAITVASSGNLNYERTQSYSLSVKATNSAGESTNKTVIINITDIADVVPILTNFSTSIAEDTEIGSTIGIVNVSDAGDTNITRFTLSDTTNFSIDSSGNITTVTTFDYETTQTYNLTVKATNSAGESTNKTITINIRNVAESVPTLDNFIASIAEDITIGSNIGTITVLDSGDTNITSFSLSDTTNFAIDSNGNITTKTSFDYETTQIYNLSVIATNTKGNSRKKTVLITITNVAETVPILENFVTSIAEDITIGSEVGTIIILTSGDTAITSFTLSDTTNFSIDSSGNITTVTTFDYETTQTYNLTVKATNSAGESTNKTITINIRNVAETVPTLDNFIASIAEDTEIGSNIGIVNVSDSGDTNITSFTLSDTTNFSIDSNGNITTVRTFDYEATQIYNLSVIAINEKGTSRSKTVTINITNVAETVPVLSDFSIMIREHSGVDIRLGIVNVLDSGDTPITKFTLSDTTNLSIDNSGLITSPTSLDYEKIPSYHLSVTATNQAGESESKMVTVIIVNYPETLPILSNFVTSIAEDIIIGSEVGIIDIKDSGDTPITRFILSGEGNECFDVSNSGVITVSSTAIIDYEIKSNYNLTVEAENWAGLSESKTVDINIINLADHKIISAIYDNKRTSDVSDDILYLYMNQSIDSNSFASSMSDNYAITGIGEIGSSSSSTYTDDFFHRHKILLNNIGTLSTVFLENSDEIIIKENQITDLEGLTSIETTKTLVKKFNIFARLKTGQSISYENGDDGDTQRGIARSYTRDDIKEVVTDNITNLMWQDDRASSSISKTWEEAKIYCQDLTLGDFNDWYLPSVNEINSIIDLGYDKPAIDTTFFKNTMSTFIWSSTPTTKQSSGALGIRLYYGDDSGDLISNSHLVRCVRLVDN